MNYYIINKVLHTGKKRMMQIEIFDLLLNFTTTEKMKNTNKKFTNKNVGQERNEALVSNVGGETATHCMCVAVSGMLVAGGLVATVRGRPSVHESKYIHAHTHTMEKCFHSLHF